MEWSQLGQIGVSFLFVIALMVGLAWLIRRFGLEKKWGNIKSSSGLLQVEDSLFLDPKRRLLVITMEQKRYVLLLDGERAHIVDTVTQGKTT